MGGYWLVYWYKGYIYGIEIVCGFDVLVFELSEFLMQNEIDVVMLIEFDVFNLQQQCWIDYLVELVIVCVL